MHQPTDKLFKSALSYVDVVRGMLLSKLPVVISDVCDWDTLKMLPTDFIDEYYRGSVADVLYQAKMKSGEDVYFLIEAQSAQNNKMPLRILDYQLSIIGQYLKKTKKLPIPAVYPFVVYSGVKRWTAPLDVSSLFGTHKFLMQKYLSTSYELIDVCRLNESSLTTGLWSGLLFYVLKNRNVVNPDLFLKNVLPRIDEVAKEAGGGYARMLLRYIIKDLDAIGLACFRAEMNRCQSELIKGEAMTLAEQMKWEGVQQGMQVGNTEGRDEAATLIATKLLEQKLGLEMVSDVTGLSMQRLEELKAVAQ